MAHWGFVHLHPFTDGNGRVARLMMNFLLGAAGLPWTTIRAEERAHFQAGIAELRVADHHRPRIVEGHPERYTARHFEPGQQAADQGLDALRGRLRARSLRVAPQDQPSPAREGES